MLVIGLAGVGYLDSNRVFVFWKGQRDHLNYELKISSKLGLKKRGRACIVSTSFMKQRKSMSFD